MQGNCGTAHRETRVSGDFIVGGKVVSSQPNRSLEF